MSSPLSRVPPGVKTQSTPVIPPRRKKVEATISTALNTIKKCQEEQAALTAEKATLLNELEIIGQKKAELTDRKEQLLAQKAANEAVKINAQAQLDKLTAQRESYGKQIDGRIAFIETKKKFLEEKVGVNAPIISELDALSKKAIQLKSSTVTDKFTDLIPKIKNFEAELKATLSKINDIK